MQSYIELRSREFQRSAREPRGTAQQEVTPSSQARTSETMLAHTMLRRKKTVPINIQSLMLPTAT